MLDRVKTALRVTTPALDGEILDLIAAAEADLRLVGITAPENDPLMIRAVITYCRCNFSSPPDYGSLKASYDEQKGQLMLAARYREGANDG